MMVGVLLKVTLRVTPLGFVGGLVLGLVCVGGVAFVIVEAGLLLRRVILYDRADLAGTEGLLLCASILYSPWFHVAVATVR